MRGQFHQPDVRFSNTLSFAMPLRVPERWVQLSRNVASEFFYWDFGN